MPDQEVSGQARRRARWLSLPVDERKAIIDTLRHACPVHEREQVDAALAHIGCTGGQPLREECKCDG